MQKRKLLAHLKNNPRGATFDDIRTLLSQEGFELDRVTGSHHIFKRSGVTLRDSGPRESREICVRQTGRRTNRESERKIEMKGELKYPIVIYPAEEGGYVAEVPALKGCLAQGDTLLECLEELKEVQTLWLESAKRHKEKVPNAAQVAAKLRKMVA